MSAWQDVATHGVYSDKGNLHLCELADQAWVHLHIPKLLQDVEGMPSA